MKQQIFLVGSCDNPACKHPVQTKRVEAIIDDGDLEEIACPSCKTGTVSWREFRIHHKPKVPKVLLWVLAVFLLAVLAFSVAAFCRLHRTYTPAELSLASQRVDNQSTAALLKALPGGVFYKSRLLGVSRKTVRLLEDGSRPSPMLESVVRGLAVQRELDGFFFVFRHYYPYTPFAFPAPA